MSINLRNALMTGGSEPSPAYWGLCFTAEASNVVVNVTKSGTPPAVTLETSADGLNWTSFDADNGTTPIILANVGDKVYFRAGSGGNSAIASSLNNFRAFTLSNYASISGDLTSILNQDTPGTALQSNLAMYKLFEGCTMLTGALGLILSSKNIYPNCYNRMFYGCAGMMSPPTMLFETCAQQCCRDMFSGCTSLTTAPALPATTLAQSCYSSMFSGCTSLTTAPALPATTLAQNCYNSMFSGCTSLTTAPALPATNIAGVAYRAMFSGCTSLTEVSMEATAMLSNNAFRQMLENCPNLSRIETHVTDWQSSYSSGYTSWVNGVSATGTFYCPAALGTNETIERGVNRCPAGWTVVNI